VWKSKFYGTFVLNRRADLHAIDATPARWRGDPGSSPLDRARTAASSPRNDLVKNCRVHPTHWLISTQVLRRRGVLGAAANARPPALLEVGAVNTQLLDARGLAVRAIDVRSSMQRIERVDFFDLRPQGSYDVVVCALVLNCLPDAAARGRMVAGLVAHLRPGGLCFLVVPRSCLERSAATTPARFDAVLRRAGLVELERRATPRLLHLCLAAGGADAAPAPAPEHRLRPRRKKANEFDVVLPAAA